jgi:hypothetical protein
MTRILACPYSGHHRAYIHFVANNLVIGDTSFFQLLDGIMKR